MAAKEWGRTEINNNEYGFLTPPPLSDDVPSPKTRSEILSMEKTQEQANSRQIMHSSSFWSSTDNDTYCSKSTGKRDAQVVDSRAFRSNLPPHLLEMIELQDKDASMLAGRRKSKFTKENRVNPYPMPTKVPIENVCQQQQPQYYNQQQLQNYYQQQQDEHQQQKQQQNCQRQQIQSNQQQQLHQQTHLQQQQQQLKHQHEKEQINEQIAISQILEQEKLAIMRMLQCAVCHVVVLPPIMQCTKGHTTCAICIDCVSGFCPSCGEPPQRQIRNEELEKLASKLQFPCANDKDGCERSLTLLEKRSHELQCPYKDFSCPFPALSPEMRCTWRGKHWHMKEHIMQSHMEDITSWKHCTDPTFVAQGTEAAGYRHWVMMTSCYGQHFMLDLVKRPLEIENENECTFEAYVQILGLKEDAKKFMCQLSVSKKAEGFSWHAKPSGLDEGFKDLIHDDFGKNDARACSDNGDLCVKLTLSRSDYNDMDSFLPGIRLNIPCLNEF